MVVGALNRSTAGGYVQSVCSTPHGTHKRGSCFSAAVPQRLPLYRSARMFAPGATDLTMASRGSVAAEPKGLL